MKVAEKVMSIGGCAYTAMTAFGILTLFSCGAPPKVTRIDYPEPSGRDIFMAQCAGCHGEDGKGNPAAISELPEAPADLTGLSKRNGGAFPTERVKDIVAGAVDIPGHRGPDQMPIWGDLFDARRNTARQEATKHLESLTAYLESIQQR